MRFFFLKTVVSWIVLLFHLACIANWQNFGMYFLFLVVCFSGFFFLSEAHLAAEAMFCQNTIHQP